MRTHYQAFLNRLRRYERLYKVLRLARRAVAESLLACLRAVAPLNPRLGPPKGFFSAHAMVRDHALRGRLVVDSQSVAPAGAGSLRRLCGYQQDGFQPWPIFWSDHSEARLAGRSLLLQDGRKRVCLEGAYYTHSLRGDPGYRYVWLPRPVRLEGNWTSIVSQWSEGFYHWFMDALPRLALLGEFPPDTRILVSGPLKAYQQDALRWLGLQDRVRETTETHLLVEHFHFSSPTAMTGCWNPYAVRFLRQAFLQRADESFPSPPRFYVRRVGQTRGVINEAEVLRLFEDRGWAVVDTERLTLAQQIRLFSNAEAVCTIHGAALTNLLWCRPGCSVVELCASNFLNGCYEGLAESLQLAYRFLVCPADSAFRVRVDTHALARLVDGGQP